MQPKNMALSGITAALLAYGNTTTATEQVPYMQAPTSVKYQEKQQKAPLTAQEAFRQGDFRTASRLFAEEVLKPREYESETGSVLGLSQSKSTSANYLAADDLAGQVAAGTTTVNKTAWKFYLGGEFGDNLSNAFADSLIPLKREATNNLPFLYLRGVSNFDEQWTAAAGVGDRFISSNLAVVGLNAFVGTSDSGKYNSPWTRIQGDVLGLGNLLDFRADYTWALDGKELIGTNTTPTSSISTFEELLSGFHGEVGTWLKPSKKLGIGLFAGYGSYEDGERGASGRAIVDLGSIVFAAQYQDFGNQWSFGLVIPIGGKREPRTNQSLQQILTERVEFQAPLFRSWDVITYREELPPPPAFGNSLTTSSNNYSLTVMGVKPEHPLGGIPGQGSTPPGQGGTPPGQGNKLPPPTPYSTEMLSQTSQESITTNVTGGGAENNKWGGPRRKGQQNEPPTPPFP